MVAIVLSFATVAPGLRYNAAYAKTQTDDNIDFQKIAPKALDKDKLEQVKKLALENDKVKELICGKKIEFVSYDFVGNIYDNPVVWTPEVHFNVDNVAQIVAVVNPENGTVTTVEEYPIVKGAFDTGKRAWATDAYTGSSTLTGLSMTSTPPTYTPTSVDSPTGLYTNALMTGSTGDPCNSFYWPGTAFFQAGFTFYPTSGYPQSGGRITWSDTNTNCNIQVTNVPYNAGNSYKFQIYSDSINHDWVIYMLNVTTGNASTTIIFGPSNYTLVTNTSGTSVFFENSNTNTTWDNQFSGKHQWGMCPSICAFPARHHGHYGMETISLSSLDVHQAISQTR